ncbi:MAG: S46 family peptidase [Bacteroidia bacterium]|nr:S46 family peptidase [Bacteroidia bacterium]
MKKITLAFLAIVMLLPGLQAKEGMWIPILLGTLNEADMQSMGMRLTAEDIYSANKSSLKDAIVKFGSGCTGEIVSADGLLFTNHHCGYSQIQSHSSLENDYLTDGFWAMNRSQELSNPGLSVTFIVRIEDVSAAILNGLDADLTEAERAQKIEMRIQEVGDAAVQGTHYEYEIKPFYYGNEYYLFVLEKYLDVRLVGAPPSSIGKYGFDTDNWVWPRHTGDFSVFRVYSGPDGKPAEYSEENIPLKPKHYFPVSLKGVEQDDFTMVYGFPARTQEYLPSFGVEMVMNVTDPIRIKARDERLRVIDREMAASPLVKIQYASKQSGISNGWKKWKGEIRGLERDDAIAKKEAYEQEFMALVNSRADWKMAYGSLLSDYAELYKQVRPLTVAVEYFGETGYALEFIRVSQKMLEATRSWSSDETEQAAAKEKLRTFSQNFFKNYYAPIDKELTGSLLEMYHDDVPTSYRPTILNTIEEEYNGDYASYANWLFANSAFMNQAKLEALIDNFDPAAVQSDPAFELMMSFFQAYSAVYGQYDDLETRIEALHRTYMKAQREVFADKTFYPDANFTLRVSYGKAEGMKPEDGVTYKYYTTLDGVVEKYIPGDREFDLPQKLITLNEDRDYGRYGKNGELRVAFLASNHTSGGNSGSPVINGDGQLVGINFDRGWEGTMSDINYDINQCRNISVDIRYVLFVIDKFAGASYLIDEMTLVE